MHPLSPPVATDDDAVAAAAAAVAERQAKLRATRRAREGRKRVHDAAIAAGRAAAQSGSSTLAALTPLQRTGGEGLLSLLGKRERERGEGEGEGEGEGGSSSADPLRLSAVGRASAAEGLAAFVDAYKRKGHVEL